MNQWVYDGFMTTYKKFRSRFWLFYESKTYLLGKDVVQIGLEKEFWKDPDGSVWIDLTDEGLDRKIVLRSDGTAVYDSGYLLRFNVKDFPDWRNGLHCW
jgi:arginyl-tRNA synthetase